MEDRSCRVFGCIKMMGSERLNEEEATEFEDSLRSLRQTISKQLKLIASRRSKVKEKEKYQGCGGNGKTKSVAPEEIFNSSEERSALVEARSSSLPLKRVAISLHGSRMLMREDKVTVRTRFVFVQVGLIDTLSGKFAGDVFIQSKWLEPLLNGRKETLTGNSIESVELEWKPNLTIQNATRGTQQLVWYKVAVDNDDTGFQATVCENRRITGQFWISTDLHRFPFDTQTLQVILSSERGETEVELIEDPLVRSSVRKAMFVDQREWTLHNDVETWPGTTVESFHRKTNNGCSGGKHPLLTATCRVSRRPSFFVWNIFLILCVISGMSFATFSIPDTSATSRIQLTLIPVVSTFSYKFAVTQNLPKVSYLTYLDKYMMSLQTLLLLTSGWHAIVAFLRDKTCEANIQALDVVVFGALFCAFVFIHVVIVFVFLLYKRRTIKNAQLGTLNYAFDEEILEDINSTRLYNKKKDAPRLSQENDHQSEVLNTLVSMDSG